MLSAKTLLGAMNEISRTMTSNRQYLIELDQRNGDGDLGISMSDGYAAAHKYLLGTQESDLGKLFVGMAKAFNEAAPSSLGTITSFLMMGMARVLKGHESADAAMLGDAFLAGVERIMEKAGSKPGEKTILDVLEPSRAGCCLKRFGRPRTKCKRDGSVAATAQKDQTQQLQHRAHCAGHIGQRGSGEDPAHAFLFFG